MAPTEIMTPAKCYAARKRLGWTHMQLADRAGVSMTELAAFLAELWETDASVSSRLRKAFTEAAVDTDRL